MPDDRRGATNAPTPAAPRPPQLPARMDSAQPTWECDGRVEGVRLTGDAGCGGEPPERATCAGAILERVRLTGGRLQDWTLRDVVLVDCDFVAVVASRGRLERVEVRRGRLSGSAWADGRLRDITVTDALGDELALRFSRLQRVAFVDCRLRSLDLAESTLEHVSFIRCDLTGARFHAARMTATRFEQCQLDGVSGVAGLRGAELDPAGLMSVAPSLAAELGIAVR